MVRSKLHSVVVSRVCMCVTRESTQRFRVFVATCGNGRTGWLLVSEGLWDLCHEIWLLCVQYFKCIKGLHKGLQINSRGNLGMEVPCIFTLYGPESISLVFEPERVLIKGHNTNN